jgi:hypothetical protein
MTNKYLEKIASLSNVKHMAHAAVDIAKKHPLPAALGVGGALDGAMSTTRRGNESKVKVGLRGIRNTIAGGATGVAAGAAAEKAVELLKAKGYRGY